jgi:hypothetical protein
MSSFRSRRTKDTVSGVSAGVVPKTVAPGRAATLMPEATFSGVLGAVAVAAEAGLDSAATGAMTVAAPSAIATASRVFLVQVITYAPS